jgi:hypothetical protein
MPLRASHRYLDDLQQGDERSAACNGEQHAAATNSSGENDGGRRRIEADWYKLRLLSNCYHLESPARAPSRPIKYE